MFKVRHPLLLWALIALALSSWGCPRTGGSGGPPPPTTQRAGEVFPPPPPQLAQQARPLEVVRVNPEKDKEVVKSVSVTFNQPFVPLASLDELEKIKPPLKLDPAVPGRYRWLGTRTVSFVPEAELPPATRFTATVPAGAEAVGGATMAQAHSWSFETRRPQVLHISPSRYERWGLPEATIVLQFNQAVDPASIQKAVTLEAAGKKVAFTLKDRQQGRTQLPSHDSEELADRRVELVPSQKLPLNSTISVKIAEGIVGTQGPLPSTEPFRSSFKTYGPLEVEEIRCWSEPCGVDDYVWLETSNPLGDDAQKYIRVQPALEKGAQVEVSGQRIYIHRGLKANTRYTLTLDAALKDSFGQKLGKRQTRSFQTSDYAPAMALDRDQILLHSQGAGKLAAGFVNVPQVNLEAVRVPANMLLWGMQQSSAGRSYPFPQELASFKVPEQRTLKLKAPLNQVEEQPLPLKPWLKEPGVYLLRATSQVRNPRWKPYDLSQDTLVQLTDLGLQVWYDHDQITAWVTDLDDTQSQSGVTLELYDGQGLRLWRGESDAQGMANAPGLTANPAPRPWYLVASRGQDMAFVVLNGQTLPGGQYLYAYNHHRNRPPTPKRLVGHIFSERGIYRPGDKVQLKGILRLEDRLGVHRLPEAVRQVKVEVMDSRDTPILEQVVDVTDTDTFSLTVPTDAKGRLGTFTVRATPQGLEGVRPEELRGDFQVEAYRAPEFAVRASLDQKDYLPGQPIQAAVEGRYLFGAPMRGAEAKLYVSLSPTGWYAPGYPGFSFLSPDAPDVHHQLVTQSTKLDQQGQGVATTMASQAQVPVTMAVEFDTEVIDANRQSVAGSAEAYVHPAEAYFGLKLDGYVYKTGESIPVEAISVDLKGQQQTGYAATLHLERQLWERKTVREDGLVRTRWDTRWEPVGQCQLTTAQEPQRCGLSGAKGGYHRVVARGKDRQGRPMATQRTLWVSGGDWQSSKEEELKLVLDKPRYQAGDKARVLLTSPWPSAHAVLVMGRLGQVRHVDLGQIGASHLHELEILPEDLPNLHIHAIAVRGLEPNKPGGEFNQRVLGADANLVVDTGPKTLQLKVKPQQEALRPGSKTRIDISAADHQGKPVAAEVTVAVVDEGVLSLIGYETPDPLQVIWHLRSSEVAVRDVRQETGDDKAQVPLHAVSYAQPQKPKGSKGASGGKRKVAASPDKILMAEEAPAPADLKKSEAEAEESDDVDGDGDGEAPARVRKNFATTAYYMATLRTGQDGQLQVDLEMPDNLTTFRVMVIANDDEDRFGSAQSAVTVNQPLLLRAALPRFANLSDRFDAGVVVNNETGQDGTLTVEVSAAGDAAPALQGDKVQTVSLASGGTQEIHFSALVERAGQASFTYQARFEAKDGTTFKDAVEGSLTVQEPITLESFATYGTTTGALSQPVVPPGEVFPDIGGLEVTLSSTLLTNLQDAIAYLVEYPYGCLEQTSSRILPLITLRDFVVRYQIAELDQAALDEMIQEGIERIVSLQTYNGGFRFWPDSQWAHPYTTAWATFVLGEARRRDHPVPAEVMEEALEYLGESLQYKRHPESSDPLDPVTLSLIAMVLAEHSPDSVNADRDLEPLFAQREALPLFARSFLILAYHKAAPDKKERIEALMSDLSNQAVEEASDVHFAEVDKDNYAPFFHSSNRTDAIALAAYLAVRPDDPLVVKAARGLMEARVGGRWNNTQENAWALLALSRYTDHYEKEVPDFMARLWLGDTFLTEQRFQGRDTRPAMDAVPMERLLQSKGGELVLARQSAGDNKAQGRLYYRLGMTWAPRQLDLKAREEGFTILRSYEVMEAGATQPGQNDTELEVPAGAYVRVHLTLVAPTERHWVVVEDLLPAGLEPVNLSFKTSLGTLQAGTTRSDYWGWGWEVGFDHTEQRDDRVLLFSDRMAPGVYQHSYIARATTPGSYYLPPARIAEMYQPEVFGRTPSGRVLIKR